MKRQMYNARCQWLMTLGAILTTQLIINLYVADFKITSDSSVTKKRDEEIVPAMKRHDESTMNNKYTAFGSRVKFIFVIGLEGTGHHLISEIIKASPSTKRLEALQIHPFLTSQLSISLFDYQTFDGLWDAHCKGGMTQIPSIHPLPTINRDHLRKQSMGREKSGTSQKSSGSQRQLAEIPRYLQRPGNTLNVKKRLEKVVTTLENIKVRTNNETSPVTVAVNPWHPTEILRSIDVGMMSYPNFRGSCRKLNYPNLDTFYQACEIARVDCEHIYIYRDPYSVLQSTIRRGMNTDTVEAIHLYTSHLHIIFSQLHAHSSRTAGCFGLFDENLSTVELWEPLSQLYGWMDIKAFEGHLETIYRRPTPMTPEQRRNLVPSKLDPVMDSLKQIHRNVMQLCRDQVSERKWKATSSTRIR